ncbi:MAG: pyruvate/2-oxoglutarate dehydrogenase complex dihydrolipoamide dehydrogenase (E3) component [Lysobacterales bacterium]|jgi:pyruvate/2-oxoglutarate dehydrogenase complex dihydrolipoamide dehydrogenase (E3) component
MKKFDAIIIGAGQAGPPLAEKLTQEGLKTAIIERQLFGGTCVNVGCIPTKTLVASARVAQLARRADEYGVSTGDISVDMKRVKARMDQVRGDSNLGVTAWLEGMDNLEIIRGHARFVGPKQIEVDGNTLEADRIFINVGARARVPDIPGLNEVPYYTNSTMMEIDFIPEHLVIIGGSYIGLEFAQMYRRFGSQVTVVEMADRLISREDDDVSAAVQKILENEGVQFEIGAECVRLAKRGTNIEITSSCDDEPRTVTASHLLLAVGRVPNTHDLGLEAAGVETNPRGLINVDDELKTSAEGIWALGEVNGRGAFTHTSYNDFEIVAANLLSEQRRRVSDRIDCYGLFIDPPLGRVGLTEQAARDAGFAVRIGTRQMSRVGRAREFGETQGFMKVVVDGDTDKILGAAILGLSGDEAIHSIIDVMNADLPYTVIQRSVHIHPTVSELIPTVFGDLS